MSYVYKYVGSLGGQLDLEPHCKIPIFIEYHILLGNFAH